MPKNTNAEGPTYAGHVDTAPHKSQPEWVDEADVSRETPEPVEPEVEDKPKRGRPAGSKNKPKTVAQAGNAAGAGSTRG